MYDIESRKHEPKNFFAGEFPTVTETGTAGAELAEYTPITKDGTGKIIAVAAAGSSGEPAATTGNVIGITAAAAAEEEPVVYYVTGEFFADALNLPTKVTIEDIKDPLRKLSIFLK